VHNAGVIRAALLPDVKLSDLDALVDLHLGCAVQMLQAALPAMRARRFGRVVLLSSRAALGLATRTSYSATKAGMQGMARTWALELAPEGITVNVVAPGPIRTDMFYDVVEQGSDRERQLAASVPVRRLGEPPTWRAPSASSPMRPTVSSLARCSTSAAAPASAAWHCRTISRSILMASRFHYPRRRDLLALAGAMTMVGTPALSQAVWPGKPVRFVVAFPPGGLADVLMRLLVPQLSEALGQPDYRQP
jgi:hypothetical protein